MERPSHILFDSHSSFSRAPLMGLAIALQFAGICFFVYGLRDAVTKFVPPILHVDPIKQPQELPRTPPPSLPLMKQIDIPKVPVPDFTTQQPTQNNGAITAMTSTTPWSQPATTSAAAGVERAPVAIAGTHTVPPYPPVERRLGIEGVVTLRLTVGTDGRVTAADIVKSAGRDALDQAARDWIIAHWRYRPALKDGNPAAVQVLASVSFSLKNQ